MKKTAHPDALILSKGEGHDKLELFRIASDLLGGREAAARALGMSDRSLRYLLAGQREIHTGLLEDISNALIDHADRCRALERQLNPAFAANREGVQLPHHRSAHAQRQLALGQDMIRAMHAAISRAHTEGRTPIRWNVNGRAMEELIRETELLAGRARYDPIQSVDNFLGIPVTRFSDRDIYHAEDRRFALIVERD